jgi:hypothetical protein
MTLNITMVAPWGLWQSSDYRLTNPRTGQVEDDASGKFMGIRCLDGAALITYTGIGRVGNESVTDWILKVLRGKYNLTVDQTLILIRESATQMFSKVARGYGLTFNIGVFISSRPWAVIITNCRPDGSVQKNFETSAVCIDEHHPGVMITGVRDAVSAVDIELLKKTARNRPRKAELYTSFLPG